jgi:glycerophosphoryl diester phosphodiesterase
VAALAPLPPAAKLVPGAGEESRGRFRALDPELPLSFSLDGLSPDSLSDSSFEMWLHVLQTQAVTWQYPLLTAERIAALHDYGFRVYAWTVDDLPTLRRLLLDGVDGLISNRPDLLVTL